MRIFVVFGMLVICPAFADIASIEHVNERDKHVVHKTGDEDISGRKTFDVAPMIPTAELPTLER